MSFPYLCMFDRQILENSPRPLSFFNRLFSFTELATAAWFRRVLEPLLVALLWNTYCLLAVRLVAAILSLRCYISSLNFSETTIIGLSFTS